MNAVLADEICIGDTVKYLNQELRILDKSDFLYGGTFITHFKLGDEGGEQIPYWITRYAVDPLYS